MATLKLFSPTVLTRKGNKNTTVINITEIWAYRSSKWLLEAETVFTSEKNREEVLNRYRNYNCYMNLPVYYPVEPGEERPSDAEYPFEVGEVVFLRDNGINTFLTIKKKLEDGYCVCNVTDSQNPGFMLTFHCYKFQNAQEYIADKIRMLDEEREDYSKLSERFSQLQQNNT